MSKTPEELNNMDLAERKAHLREEKRMKLHKTLKNAKEHPAFSQEELAEILVDAWGIDAKYLVGPLKVMLKRRYEQES